MLYAIWCQFYNLKNVKNIHGGVLLLVKLQVLTVFWTYILIKAKYFIGFFWKFEYDGQSGEWVGQDLSVYMTSAKREQNWHVTDPLHTFDISKNENKTGK